MTTREKELREEIKTKFQEMCDLWEALKKETNHTINIPSIDSYLSENYSLLQNPTSGNYIFSKNPSQFFQDIKSL